MSKRKIAVVTESRASYGLLYWLCKEIQQDSALELQLIVTGSHLAPEFGATYQQIEADGFEIAAKVEMLLSSNSAVGVAKAIGLGVISFSDCLTMLQPDLVVVLGDRFETLAVAQAVMVLKLPLAHIHGGEVTAGAIDDSFRHAITKMAHVHFPVTAAYAERVCQLGEDPQRIFNLGAPGLDHVTRSELLSLDALASSLGINFAQRNFLVTYHPVTVKQEHAHAGIETLFEALRAYPDTCIIFTKSNADEGGRLIGHLLDEFCAQHDNMHVFTSLGLLNYLSLAKNVDVVIGNSSSGLIEVPAVATPTVNIGDRQTGRQMASSVISCDEEVAAIQQAITTALSDEFQHSLANIQSPYGGGDASASIKNKLKTLDLDGLCRKQFYDFQGVTGETA